MVSLRSMLTRLATEAKGIDGPLNAPTPSLEEWGKCFNKAGTATF